MTTYYKDIQKHVVTFGDYGFATKDQPLWVKVGSGRNARLVYNVSPGQIVAYRVANGVATTLDHTSLTAADLPNLFIGVGHDSVGAGYTTDILHLGIEGISGCRPQKVSTSSPRCGNPGVQDFYFDCTKCDETYTVMVGVDDNKTRSYAPFNRSFAEYVGSVVTNCSSCDNCPVEHNCKEVACKLADALNNETVYMVGNQQYPDWKGKGLPQPFFATRLHENSAVYCIVPQSEEGGCEDCTYLNAIKGVRIRGTNYDFSGNLNPADSTQTLPGQLDGIIAQINESFIVNFGGNVETGINPHAGSAYKTGTYQKCCGLQIHVNTCDATFALYDMNDDIIEPTVDWYNPFTTYGTTAASANCVDCADAAVAAQATLTLTGQPSDTQTFTVGGRTYTLQTVLTNVDGNILIGATTADTINNIVAAVNLNSGAGTTYAAATTANTQVSANDGPGNTVVFTALTPGTAGNAFASTETMSNASFGGATFSGGVAATAGASQEYNCGIRIIAEQIKGDCSCYIDQPLAFYGRRIFINPIGEGWRGKPWKVVEVQAMELPAGFGSWIQWLELQNIPEGTGRRYGRSNYQRKWLALPAAKSRVNHAVTARCDKNYCSYFLQTLSPKTKVTTEPGQIVVNSNLHIPSTDDTTIIAWELFLDALIDLNPQCSVLTTTACDTALTSCE